MLGDTMDVAEVLTLATDGLAPLHRPIMVLALRGWFDVAQVATDAVDHMTSDRLAPVVGSIEPDPFFDFTVERPTTELDDDGNRRTCWPENELRILRRTQPERSNHDLIVLSGVEPHLRYATFAECLITVATTFAVEVVVT